jgi:hypothetical protein
MMRHTAFGADSRKQRTWPKRPDSVAARAPRAAFGATAPKKFTAITPPGAISLKTVRQTDMQTRHGLLRRPGEEKALHALV